MGKAQLLDTAQHTSVRSICENLNNGRIPAPVVGYCVVLSEREQKYYLLYRSDKEAAALAALGIEGKPADPAKLTDYLFLGSKVAAQDNANLKAIGVTHILNVADDVECFHEESFTYLHCKVADGGCDKGIVDWFGKATEFVSETRRLGGRVLIHCNMGVNRSATVAMAVLMHLEECSLKEAYHLTRSRRSCVQPFVGNKHFIAKWEQETRGKCTLPEWLRLEGAWSVECVVELGAKGTEDKFQ